MPNKDEEVRLKPCPFCGAGSLGPEKQTKPIDSRKRPVWEISCSQYCVAMYRRSKRQVIADWNKRSIPRVWL